MASLRVPLLLSFRATVVIPLLIILSITILFPFSLRPPLSKSSSFFFEAAAADIAQDELLPSPSSCRKAAAAVVHRDHLDGDDDDEACRESLLNSDSSNIMLYSIILPTYNERENLPLITQFLHDTFTIAKLPYEIVVVDDSSPDNTLAVAKSLQQLFGQDRFRIVSRPGKLGLGSAYSAGLKASSGQRILLMDADLSHHPKYIPQMIAVMDGDDGVGKGGERGATKKKKKRRKPDIVSGTRYCQGGGVAGWDTKRKLTSCGANFLASFLLRTGGASDLTGSFRLYERHAIEKILPQVKCTGYAFQMEILVRAHKAGMTIGEVPIIFVDRIYGESKLGANEIILYLKGLLNLFFTT